MERLTLQEGRQCDRNIRDANEAPAHFDCVPPMELSAKVGVKQEQDGDLQPVVGSIEEPCHERKNAASLYVRQVRIVVLVSQHAASCTIIDVDVDHDDASDQYANSCGHEHRGHVEASVLPSCQYDPSQKDG